MRLQEVMHRGAEEIGKILNKGLDRQARPATGLKAGLPGEPSRGAQWGEGTPLVGLQVGLRPGCTPVSTLDSKRCLLTHCQKGSIWQATLMTALPFSRRGISRDIYPE